jgi:hypothetical protein
MVPVTSEVALGAPETHKVVELFRREQWRANLLSRFLAAPKTLAALQRV